MAAKERKPKSLQMGQWGRWDRWDNVFKLIRTKLNFFQGDFPQILLGPFLNILIQIFFMDPVRVFHGTK